jgi:hypothetical protein
MNAVKINETERRSLDSYCNPAKCGPLDNVADNGRAVGSAHIFNKQNGNY